MRRLSVENTTRTVIWKRERKRYSERVEREEKKQLR